MLQQVKSAFKKIKKATLRRAPPARKNRAHRPPKMNISERICPHYLSQGVDQIHTIDDNSPDKTIYDEIINDNQVSIHFDYDIINRDIANHLYNEIRNNYQWIICWCWWVYLPETLAKPSEMSFKLLKNADCVRCPGYSWALTSWRSHLTTYCLQMFFAESW